MAEEGFEKFMGLKYEYNRVGKIKKEGNIVFLQPVVRSREIIGQELKDFELKLKLNERGMRIIK